MLSKTIIANTSAQLIGRLVSAAAGFLATIILARYLGGTLYGYYVTAVSYVALFYIVADFGMNTVFLKYAQDKINLHFTSLLTLRIAFGLVVTLISIGGAYLLTYVNPSFTDVVQKTILIASLSIVGHAVYISTNALFQYRERYDYSAVALGVGALVALGLTYGMREYFETSQGAFVAAVIVVVGAWLTAGISLVFTKQRNVLSISEHVLNWKQLLRLSWPLGVTLILNTVYFYSGILILAAFRPAIEVGAFGLAYKFFEFSLILPTFLMNSIYPRLLKERGSKFNNSIKSLMFVLGLLSLLVLGGLWFSSPLISSIKAEYTQSVWMLRWLGFSLPIFYLTSPLMWLYIIYNKHTRLIIIYATSLVVNLLLCWYLIPQFGALGAIWAITVSEALILIMGLLLLKY